MSKIEWTEVTWNPVTGCEEVSPGCDNCYARRISEQKQKAGVAKYARGFELVEHPGTLEQPLSWRKPRMVFVNSMSDLFHPKVSRQLLQGVCDTMWRTQRHTYQILTKRPKVARAFFRDEGDPPPNTWVGVSVENQLERRRIDVLRDIPSMVRFLSVEPLLEDVGDLDLTRIDWVIVGGESGPGARPMHPDWVRSVRDQTVAAGVPFFFKQWGGVKKSRWGRDLDGKEWNEYPERKDLLFV